MFSREGVLRLKLPHDISMLEFSICVLPPRHIAGRFFLHERCVNLLSLFDLFQIRPNLNRPLLQRTVRSYDCRDLTP